jgi:hypothetical protein
MCHTYHTWESVFALGISIRVSLNRCSDLPETIHSEALIWFQQERERGRDLLLTNENGGTSKAITLQEIERAVCLSQWK